MASAVIRRCCFKNIFKSVDLTSYLKQQYSSSCVLSSNFIRNRNSIVKVLQIQNSFKRTSFPVVNNYIDVRYYSKLSDDEEDDKKIKVIKKKEVKEKLSIFQRFKQMYRDYWYVLVPVHFVTSTMWLGGFYYLAKSGVDIPSLLESMSISEKITNSLRDSSMGYLAVSYALYKITTPARYAVTLGGTTVSINYLKKWGYIKPVPSADKLKEIYQEKRDNIIETVRETKEGFKMKADKIEDKIKDTKDNLVDDLGKGINKIKETTRTIQQSKEQLVETIDKSVKKIQSQKK